MRMPARPSVAFPETPRPAVRTGSAPQWKKIASGARLAAIQPLSTPSQMLTRQLSALRSIRKVPPVPSRRLNARHRFTP